MTKRFAVYPGTVTSRSDGDKHRVSGAQLIRLYGVNPAECYIVRNIDGERIDPAWLSLIVLPSGDYEETLLRWKADDFRRYTRARKLWKHHTSGHSFRRANMREIAAEFQAKVIAQLERRWPDFEATYDKREKAK